VTMTIERSARSRPGGSPRARSRCRPRTRWPTSTETRPIRHPPVDQGPADVGREHRQLALREVHDVGGLIDHDQGERQAGVDATVASPETTCWMKMSIQYPRYARRIASSLRRTSDGPSITTRPVSSRNTWSPDPARAPHSARRAGCSLRSDYRSENPEDLAHDQRRQPQRRLVEQQEAGRSISARATASICCSPPESVPAACRRRSRNTGK